MRWPHRPSVQLFLPREVRAGDHFETEVRIVAKRPVRVGAVTVRVEGSAWATTFLRLRADLFPGGELPEGETRLRCRVELPADVPPSFRGTRIRVGYRVSTHVDIPWWPDRDASFELPVLPPELPLPDERPFHFSTRPEGPLGGQPHLEGILDRRVLAVGDSIAGRIALSNLGVMRPSSLDVALVAQEAFAHEGAGVDGQRYVLALPLPLADGEPVSFHMRVPSVTPTFESAHGALRWKLVVTAKHARGVLRVPIPIELRAADESVTARRLVPALPSIGNARVAKLWSRIGGEHGFVLEEGVLVWQRGDLKAEIAREHRGREGVHLVARLTWPDLGLALRGGPRSVLGKILTQLALEGEAAPGSFFGDHAVEARFEAQGRAAVRLLFPDSLGEVRVAELRDDGAMLEHAGGTEDPGVLSRFVAFARSVVENAEALLDHVPPPDPLSNATLAWEAWVRELDEGRLQRVFLTAEGVFEGARVRVGHSPSLEAFVVVAADAPLGPCFVARDAIDLAQQPKLDSETRALAASVLEAGDIEVREDEVELRLAAMLEDPAGIEALLRRVVRLTARLRRGVGPYR
jgi:hypothetical protein